MREADCRRVVLRRSGGFCERCCRNGPLTMHHRLKRSQGGAWCPTNIVALCGHGTAGCHGWVEHNPNAAAEGGWHVRSWAHAGDTPVLYRGNAWAHLKETGEIEYVNREEIPCS